MKLLVATNHSYMLWQFRRELLQELAGEHEVVISTPFVGHEKDLEGLGCRLAETKLDRRGINPVRDLSLLRFYWRLLRRERPQLVTTYSIKPNVYLGLCCRLLKIPYCSNVQGLGTAFQRKLLALLARLMYRVGLRGASTVFFENQANLDLFRSMGIVRGDQPVLLPGAGVNLQYHMPRAYPRQEPVRFLYLGRIMKEKGLSELFSAMEQLHGKYKDRVVLDLVGFYEDEYRDTVERLEKLGIVQFHGFQEDPRGSYANSHCVVLPSHHEGMSNVLLEAAAATRPVITSDIPGCRESVEEGRSGLLCRARDTGSLLAAMERFMELSVEQRAEMGLRGREKMLEEFDRRNVVAAVTKRLEEAAHG